MYTDPGYGYTDASDMCTYPGIRYTDPVDRYIDPGDGYTKPDLLFLFIRYENQKNELKA